MGTVALESLPWSEAERSVERKLDSVCDGARGQECPRHTRLGCGDVIVSGATRPAGKRLHEYRHSEKRGREEQVTGHRSAEEREAHGVRRHESAESPGIHS